MKIKKQIQNIVEKEYDNSFDYGGHVELNCRKITSNIEPIVEDIAIQFAEWCSLNYWNYSDMEEKWLNVVEKDTKTAKELFETFKKEKGL